MSSESVTGLKEQNEGYYLLENNINHILDFT